MQHFSEWLVGQYMSIETRYVDSSFMSFKEKDSDMKYWAAAVDDGTSN